MHIQCAYYMRLDSDSPDLLLIRSVEARTHYPEGICDGAYPCSICFDASQKGELWTLAFDYADSLLSVLRFRTHVIMHLDENDGTDLMMIKRRIGSSSSVIPLSYML